MNRIQQKCIKKDLKEKMVLLAGPRQVGKTWISENIYSKYFYLNWDDEDDKRTILNSSWSRNNDLIIFDELHKKPKWKSWLKGVIDKEKNRPPILTTGSAKMNIFRKGGDSLAGRYFLHRLYPISVVEAVHTGISADDAIKTMLITGGFPEPFLKGKEIYAKRWRGTHIDRIITEDLLTFERVNDIGNIELLVEFLSQRVGSPVSYLSLSRDISVSPHTVKKWITILENLFIVFRVTPYSKRLQRTLSKEPKIYFYDIGRLPKENIGAKLENLTALSLLKRNSYLEDTLGEKNSLHYIRDREKREADFLTLRDGVEEFLIEVKSSGDNVSPALDYFSKRVNCKKVLQLSYDLKREKNYHGIEVKSLASFLTSLEI